MAARKKRPDRLRELKLRVAVDHPGWSPERQQAEIVRAQLGQGPYGTRKIWKQP